MEMRKIERLASRYDSEFFESVNAQSLASARVVVPLVMGLVQPKKVVDVGCGQGVWLHVFLEHGVEAVRGLDGV